MDKFKSLLKIIVIAGLGYAAILVAINTLAATGLLDRWMAGTTPEALSASVIGRAVTFWLFSLPFAFASLMMTPSRLKDICLWAPLYAPLAVLVGITLARL